MELQTLYQICIFFSIGLMVFTLAINFTVGLGVFGNVTPSGGMDTSGNSTDIVKNFTKNPDTDAGFGNIWLMVLGGSTAVAALGSIGIAIATQNASFVSVYIFSVYFWASYLNALSILAIVAIPASFLLLFTVPIGFIFVGAIVGMLAGV